MQICLGFCCGAVVAQPFLYREPGCPVSTFSMATLCSLSMCLVKVLISFSLCLQGFGWVEVTVCANPACYGTRMAFV